MTITRINEFEAAEGKEDALRDFLQGLLPYIKSSEGCIDCELLQHQENHQQFVVIEKWHSVEAHQQSIANYPKEQMQAAMALIGAPPRGNYYGTA